MLYKDQRRRRCAAKARGLHTGDQQGHRLSKKQAMLNRTLRVDQTGRL